MNSTTNSGDGLNACQYALAASRSTCSRTCRACASSRAEAQRLVGGLGGLQVGGQRDLGVDHDVLAAGQPHDHVGPHAPSAWRGRPARRSRSGAASRRSRRPGAAAARPSGRAPPAAAAPVTSAWSGPGAARELCRTKSICLASSACGRRAGPTRSRAAAPRPGRACPCSGSTRCSTACLRCSRSPAASALAGRSRVSASSRNRTLLTSRACADRAWKRSASCSST